MKQVLDFLEKQDFVADFIKMFKSSITSIQINTNLDAIEFCVQENIADTMDKEHYRTYLHTIIDDPVISSEVKVDHKIICLRNRDIYAGKINIDVYTDVDDTDILQIYFMLSIPSEAVDAIKNQPDVSRGLKLFTSPPYKEKVEEIHTAINKLSRVEAKHRLSLYFEDKKTENPYIEAGYIQHAILDLTKIIDVFKDTSFQYIDTFAAFRSKRIFLFRSEDILLKIIQARRTNLVQIEISVEAGACIE